MENRIIGIIAPKGSGKTYTVLKEIPNMERVAVFDLIRENAYLCCEPMYGKPRLFAETINLQQQFKIAYRPTNVTIDEKNDVIRVPELNTFVLSCYLRGDMWMVIDEAHLLLTSRTCPPPILLAGTIGRHRSLNIVYIAQSFSAVSMPLRSNTDEFMFWKIIEPTSLVQIKERCGQEVMQKVWELRATIQAKESHDGKHHAGQMLHWSKQSGLIKITE